MVAMRVSYRVARAVVIGLARVYFRQQCWGLSHVPRCGGVLLASNHQSFADPLLVTCLVRRECHYMARDTLFANRHFGRLIRFVNAFPIKRATGDIAGVKEALRRLKNGAALLTFPEGTRSPDGRVRPFLPGVVAIARKARVPIVPLAIEGAFESWPKGRRFPHPARVCVGYGPPVQGEQLADLDAATATAVLTDRVRALHNELRVRMAREPFEYEARETPALSEADPTLSVRERP